MELSVGIELLVSGEEVVPQQGICNAITEGDELEGFVLHDVEGVRDGICDPEVGKLHLSIGEPLPGLLGEDGVGDIEADGHCTASLEDLVGDINKQW